MPTFRPHFPFGWFTMSTGERSRVKAARTPPLGLYSVGKVLGVGRQTTRNIREHEETWHRPTEYVGMMALKLYRYVLIRHIHITETRVSNGHRIQPHSINNPNAHFNRGPSRGIPYCRPESQIQPSISHSP